MHTPDSEQPGDMNDEAAAQADEEEEDDEALDMDEFEESGMLDLVDPAVALTTRKTEKPETNKTEGASALDSGDSVLHTRTYDLHITYDKYYQTPRLWVVGYDEVKSFFSIKMNIILNIFFITES